MRDPKDKGHLIPNPETAPIVKQIFEWRKNGIGPSRIVTMLNEKGYPTPSGYKKTNYLKLRNWADRIIDSKGIYIQNIY